jgi:hypothetical protein
MVQISPQSIVNYHTDSANVSLVNGTSLLSGLAVTRGTAVVNGLAVTRSAPVLNGANVTDTSNNNLAVIIDSLDFVNDSISTLKSISMITGITAGVNTIVPAAMLSDNFDITYGLGHLSITPASLLIKALDTTTIYGVPAAFSDSVYGFQYLDSIGNVMSTLPTHTLTDTLGNPVNGNINAGKYIIVPGGVTLIPPPNYTISYVNAKLTVGKVPLTAFVKDTSRVYGAANPNFVIQYNGFVNGDGASSIATPPVATTTATIASQTGLYPIKLTGGLATNYTIVDSNTHLTITQASLTATADNLQRFYGDPNPVFTITYNGFLNGGAPSQITPPTASSAANALSPVGTYPILLSGGSAMNYTIQDVNGTLTLAPSPLTVTANDIGINSGSNAPVFTSTISGLRNGETSTGGPVYTTNPLYTGKSAPGVYSIIPSGLQLTNPVNYAISYVAGNLYVNDANGKNVVPKLDCVQPLTNDPSGLTFAAHFSYSNPNATVVYQPVGTNNNLTTTSRIVGQLPVVFQPGSGKFTILFDGTKLTWTLTTNNGNHSTAVATVASSTSSRCPAGTSLYTTGVESVSSTETMEQATLEPTNSAYPNPTRGLVTIYIKDGTISTSKILVTNAYGQSFQSVGKLLTDHSVQVDLSGMATGVYFVKAMVNGEWKVFRVMKN